MGNSKSKTEDPASKSDDPIVPKQAEEQSSEPPADKV